LLIWRLAACCHFEKVPSRLVGAQALGSNSVLTTLGSQEKGVKLMADHSKAHLWFNTFIAASAVSSVFAWRTYNLKAEDLGFVSNLTFDCKLEYHDDVLGICWHLTITNQAETRTSIVHEAIVDLEKPSGTTVFKATRYFRFTEFATDQGTNPFASSPVVLDAGEARRFLVRLPVHVPDNVAKVINGVMNTSQKNELQIKDIQKPLADSGLDMIGNALRPGSGFGYLSEPRQVSGQIWLTTGRENRFTAQLV
jgi:hypothetical protein